MSQSNKNAFRDGVLITLVLYIVMLISRAFVDDVTYKTASSPYDGDGLSLAGTLAMFVYVAGIFWALVVMVFGP